MIHGGGKAKYYNGLVAIPAIGEAHYYSGYVRFIGVRDGSQHVDVRYPVASRISMERDPSGNGRLRFPHPKNRSLEVVIVIEDQNYYNRLVKIVKKEKGISVKRIQLMITEASFWKKIAVAIIAGAFVLIGFFYTVNHIYQFIPANADKRIGRYGYSAYIDQNHICENERLNKTIGTMISEMRPSESKFEYRFTVVESEDSNAFAFPGGFLIINSALLEQSESQSEIAGVLAHEMGHVERRHGLRQLVRMMGIAYMTSIVLGSGLEGLEGVDLAETSSEIASTLLILKYSRDFEEEADEYATNLLADKGIGISGLVSFFEKVLQLEKNLDMDMSGFLTYLNTHPDTADRILRLKENEKAAKEKPKKARSVYFPRNWNQIKVLCN